MGDEILNKHPVLQMLDDNEPEAVEYWLHDDGLTRIYADFEDGRINGPTYHERLKAWVAAWRKRLDVWQATLPSETDAHLLTTRVWVRPGHPASNDRDGIPKHLLPQKVRPKPRGQSR
jgi:hypothetical protein